MTNIPNIPGVNRVATYVKGMMGAEAGKKVSNAVVAGGKTASGVAAHAKNMKIAKYAMQNKKKAVVMGAMGIGAAEYVVGRTRRGAGASKTVGRPTGMYKY